MKIIFLILCFTFFSYCKSDDSFVVQQETGLKVDKVFENCNLIEYGVFEKIWKVAVGGFYKCDSSAEITTSTINMGIFNKWLYSKIVTIVIKIGISAGELTEAQSNQIISFMKPFGDLPYKSVVSGIYDFKSETLQLFLTQDDVKTSMGIFDLKKEDYYVYKKTIESNMKHKTFI